MIKYRRWINAAVILGVIAFQLTTAVRTLADDGGTPEETPVVTPTDDPAVTEEATATPEATGTEEATATDEATATEELSPTDTPADATEETATEETAAPESTETATPDGEETPAPDGEEASAEPDCIPASEADAAAAETGGEGGEAAPAESGEEALPVCEDEIEEDLTVTYSDPMWCPAGQVPGDPGCTPSFATITELIDFLIAESANPSTPYQGDGAIYFQAGDYTGPEEYIVINYTVVPQLGTLEVLGGWDLDPTGGYDGNTGTTTFTVPVVIVWDDDVTVEDVVVDLSASPSSDTGVFVYTDGGGDVTLTNVTVTGGSYGAMVVNYEGTGNVTVTNSVFSENDNIGLTILTSGNVTLTQVVADNNNTGILIDSTTGAEPMVQLTNVFVNGNGYTGLEIYTVGDISLDNVNSTGGTTGVYLDTTYGWGNIFVENSSFSGATDINLRVVTSTGDIAVQTSSTDGGSLGAWLKSMDGGTITVTDSVFTGASTGLFVVGTGDVTLTNVEASGNTGDGALVESGWVFGCFGPDGINVTVDGGTYQNNTNGYGFVVYPGPNGTVTLAGTIAGDGNGQGDSNIDLTRTCVPYTEEKPAKPYQVVEVSGEGDDPAAPDCEHYAGLLLILPDQSRVKVTCPIDGEVTVATVAEEDLPGESPKSFTVIAGLVVVANETDLLPEGSSMQMCFKIPEGMEGKHYAILYWDPTANDGAGGWVELPANQYGGQVFPLHPDTPEDGMQILEGVYQCGDCVCVRVNFTGTFILVAR